MDDRALYATILGIAPPWQLSRVELDNAAKAVHVWLEERADTSFACPECGRVSAMYDHVERSWRHLDTCQYETRLHARVPRVDCAEHGVKTVTVPWATPHSRFTVLFERLAIAWLKEATPAAVARRLGLTWDEANGIVERAVRRGLARRPTAAARYLGIDEHSYLKHLQFVTMVVDLEQQTVLHVADDRTADTLADYFDGLSIDERLAIEAVAMDMWDPVSPHRPRLRAGQGPQDRVRPVPRHAPRDRGDGPGPAAREPRAPPAGRSPAHRHRVSLAQNARDERGFHRGGPPAVSAAAPEYPQVGPRVGDEGSLSPALGLPLDPRCPRLLRTLAGVGDPVAAPADDPRRRDHPASPRQRPELHHLPAHERRHGGAEREDSMDQVFVAWLSEPRAIQAGDLLPLRRPRSRSLIMRTL